ncbi:uncharacterized protein [Macrobrachium rosenbergii]|uniref:uncharacterized protein n=1 Tax=Macrobrachium rosenbergii TaxID=79674 RepID=UPI0034D75248
MTQISNDRAKFEEIGLPDYQTIFRTEDKINRFLRSLKNENIINENTYQDLFVTGSSFGILYGLPKVHKPDVPLRPILASYRTPNYKLAKFLVPLLESLTSNKYTVTNSEHFKQRILPQDSDLFMASFDVESLFTNIPVRETIDIILDKLFPTLDSSYHNFSRSHFKMFLELAVLDTAFIFNGVLFRQIEGMAMGSPLGPTFANIFMCSLEEQLLDECPLAYRPLFYARYVDDTFILFKQDHDAERFLEFSNSYHHNITFTIEKNTTQASLF